MAATLGISSIAGLLVATCFPTPPETVGSCTKVLPEVLDCQAPGFGEELKDAGLVGYVCTGSARPDLEASFIDGVPRGLLCADRGPVPGSGSLGEGGAGTEEGTGYCCTAEEVDCAYDPVSDCEDPSYGYRCWGANRPESLNPALSCSNGNREGERAEYVNYCCENGPRKSACQQTDAIGCSERMLGFLCEGDSLPRGENLGPNKSRADFFHPACTIPTAAPNPDFKSYCCYMPALVPIGGTCVNHTSVPGCEPGRFGFACYGPDRPEDDYLPMRCDDGFKGSSAEGYEASLYCCDFE